MYRGGCAEAVFNLHRQRGSSKKDPLERVLLKGFHLLKTLCYFPLSVCTGNLSLLEICFLPGAKKQMEEGLARPRTGISICMHCWTDEAADSTRKSVEIAGWRESGWVFWPLSMFGGTLAGFSCYGHVLDTRYICRCSGLDVAV